VERPVAHAAPVCDKLQKFIGSRKKQKLLKNTKHAVDVL
jgi:hypothetical protein